jgi:3-hydroxybutyrate dehydrogenase
LPAHFDFTGKSVLVSGASRGIGYGVAEAFAKAGADVIVLSGGEGIEAAAEAISKECGQPVRGIRCDISDAQAVDEALAGIERLDVLVNNAGLERPTPVVGATSETDETFRRIIDINIMGTWYVTRAALPKMGPGGRIIITSSIWGRTAVAEFGAYCASKHANVGFMRSLSKELGPKGITVNAVCPGWVRTEASMRTLRRTAEEQGWREADMEQEIVAAQSLAGLMEPEDMAGTYLFLASDAASNITGQAINADRGEVMS